MQILRIYVKTAHHSYDDNANIIGVVYWPFAFEFSLFILYEISV
jgi:hypothetical protein